MSPHQNTAPGISDCSSVSGRFHPRLHLADFPKRFTVPAPQRLVAFCGDESRGVDLVGVDPVFLAVFEQADRDVVQVHRFAFCCAIAVVFTDNAVSAPGVERGACGAVFLHSLVLRIVLIGRVIGLAQTVSRIVLVGMVAVISDVAIGVGGDCLVVDVGQTIAIGLESVGRDAVVVIEAGAVTAGIVA